MDGENNGKPYFLMDWFGGKTHHLRKHQCRKHLHLDGWDHLLSPFFFVAVLLEVRVLSGHISPAPAYLNGASLALSYQAFQDQSKKTPTGAWNRPKRTSTTCLWFENPFILVRIFGYLASVGTFFQGSQNPSQVIHPGKSVVFQIDGSSATRWGWVKRPETWGDDSGAGSAKMQEHVADLCKEPTLEGIHSATRRPQKYSRSWFRCGKCHKVDESMWKGQKMGSCYFASSTLYNLFVLLILFYVVRLFRPAHLLLYGKPPWSS